MKDIYDLDVTYSGCYIFKLTENSFNLKNKLCMIVNVLLIEFNAIN